MMDDINNQDTPHLNTEHTPVSPDPFHALAVPDAPPVAAATEAGRVNRVKQILERTRSTGEQFASTAAGIIRDRKATAHETHTDNAAAFQETILGQRLGKPLHPLVKDAAIALTGGLGIKAVFDLLTGHLAGTAIEGAGAAVLGLATQRNAAIEANIVRMGKEAAAYVQKAGSNFTINASRVTMGVLALQGLKTGAVHDYLSSAVELGGVGAWFAVAKKLSNADRAVDEITKAEQEAARRQAAAEMKGSRNF